ncbi:MAG: glycoside hydrolase N-terminal domain-containing protein [Muribaculaceae bacterium]|nr:glycoside hydrolase N-terminal domain-containing protein [Muribaculaceae bacterium]
MKKFLTGIIIAAVTIPAAWGAKTTDYRAGNAIWFDKPNSSTEGVAVWKKNDFSGTPVNPDPAWESKSLPIGNGSFGGTIMGSVGRERVVLNEKTLWPGGPATGVERYWDMNRHVSDSTLAQIRTLLENGQNSEADKILADKYRGKISYDRNVFGCFTMLGEAYVTTGIDESKVQDYTRVLNIDNSIAAVQFSADGTDYTREYFASYPDSVMVWRFRSTGSPQQLTFAFDTPQQISAITAAKNGLIYTGTVENNGMQWALRVYVRTSRGKITPDAAAGTITVTGSSDVEFILAADTDYRMNFNPDMTDPKTYVGPNPVTTVNAMIDAAVRMSYKQLYARHLKDYKTLYDRVDLAINPSETFSDLPTPERLKRYREGTLDHDLEKTYFQYGRYLLISSSRPGTLPANLQGLWHNNLDGPWRVDYHNNINLQMNYWPANSTNLSECFVPFVDYVRTLVKPGERTAKDYYGARGWTAEVSTNPFGFTAPLNDGNMSWNYNPTAGPWLASQIWEYYDYTRDKDWLREVGYPIIKSSADFVTDLLYKANGTYTSAPSTSPEHGQVDLGATYANAVTRQVLMEAIKAAKALDTDAESVAEWEEKLANMYPYQVGRMGQLQEWYHDIDREGDKHRHTNHLFGLHPGNTIDPVTDKRLADACKETLRQRGDAATGWSMGWKLNHWARLLDGDHAYVLFQNLLKNGTGDNLWDVHPPFQIDGNFGGTAGIVELFLQSHNGTINLLPALPSQWKEGHINGLRARGNFEVDINYTDGRLDKAVIRSLSGEPAKVYYQGKTLEFPTSKGRTYTISYNPATDKLTLSK